MGALATTVGVTAPSGLTGTSGSYNWSQLGVPQSTTITGPLNVSLSDGNSAVVTSAGNSFQLREQGSSWAGTFPSGMYVLWDNGVGPDFTISLLHPVSGIGADIGLDYGGSFTAEISAYASNGSLLGTYSEAGGASPAIFLGIADSTADIAKVQFTISSGSHPQDFAIGTLDESKVTAPVPLPAAAWLLVSGLGVVGFMSRKRKLN
jgi:hypothetical protein